MTTKQAAVFGIFGPGGEVDVVIDKLLSIGFLNSNIKLLCPITTEQVDIERLQKTMILYFTKIGAGVGLILFFITGLAIVFGSVDAVLSVDLVFLDKIHILLFTTLFGLIFGAASGALIGIGTPQSIELRFSSYIEAGASLLSVRVSNLDEECIVKNSLEFCGALDIAKLNEKHTWESIRVARSQL